LMVLTMEKAWTEKSISPFTTVFPYYIASKRLTGANRIVKRNLEKYRTFRKKNFKAKNQWYHTNILKEAIYHTFILPVILQRHRYVERRLCFLRKKQGRASSDTARQRIFNKISNAAFQHETVPILDFSKSGGSIVLLLFSLGFRVFRPISFSKEQKYFCSQRLCQYKKIIERYTLHFHLITCSRNSYTSMRSFLLQKEKISFLTMRCVL
jgi:hypothetical protein